MIKLSCIFTFIISNTTKTNDKEVIYVDTSISTTLIKPSFPYMGKFISNKYKEMHMRLNKVVIVTNVAYKYYPAEYKLTLP